MRLVLTEAGEDPYILKCCLSGEPRNLVENLVSYETIWEHLIEIYGSERRFILSLLNEVFCHAYDLSNDSEMICFINKITFAWDQLSHFNLKDEMDNLSIMLSIENILPKTVKLEWFRHSKTSDKVTCEGLVEFLKVQRWTLEYDLYITKGELSEKHWSRKILT